jgi:Dienelactone hydrolase family
MPPILFPAVIALAAALLAGCCHLRESCNPRQARPVPAETAALVAYRKPALLSCTESNLETNGRFIVQRITMPAAASKTNRALELDYYRPFGTNHTPVIVVLPIIGGGYPLEKFFSAYFARQGMAAVLVRRDSLKRTLDDLQEINDTLQQAAIDARQAIDWIETRPELDASRLGVFGISMGGIRAAFLAPLDSRIRAAIVGLAGGDLPYIIAHSKEGGIVRRREPYLQKHGITRDEFERELRTALRSDPLMVAPSIDPHKILMVLARFDNCVPSKKGFELRRAMGKPETIIVPTGHYTALLYIPYIKSACLRFFKEKFADDSSAPDTSIHQSVSWKH